MSQQRRDPTKYFELPLRGVYEEGMGGGHIQMAQWAEGFAIELEGGRRAGVVTDRESLIALRDKLTALLDATAPKEPEHGGD